MIFKIDPVSIQGVKDLVKKLEDATVQSAEDTATDVTKNMTNNLRTGYVSPVIGDGSVWTPISDQREYELIRANLMPHEGLVAETRKLIGSLSMKNVGNNTFKISVASEYAAVHEFGGGRTQIPPRPYFYPAINHLKAEKTHEKIIKKNVEEAIKGAQK